MRLSNVSRRVLPACLAAVSVIGLPLRAQEPGTAVGGDHRVLGKTYVFRATGREIP